MEYPKSYTKYLATLPYAPSEEQTAIVNHALREDGNMAIGALAGAAKTSTLKLLAHALPQTNIICLAFNKSIANEMKAELPSNCTSMTLNSLGHRAWGGYLGTRLKLNDKKNYQILVDLLEKEFSRAEAEELREEFAYLLQCANHAKSAGHLPDRFFEEISVMHNCKRLMTDEELIASLDEKVSHTFTEALIMLLNRSAFRAMEGTIDFGDQILFPSLFKCRYPIFTLILVDEAQDLSPLNHEMLDQLYRRRMIAVGDSNQAIYAFRGAFEDGMDQLISRFDMKEFSLSTTFRCPEMIVKHVHWKTPHMRWFPSNTEGAIEHKAGWTTDDLPRECAILCRNNAPLFSLAIKLLRQHRYAKLWANDIAAGLLKTMKDLGGRSSLQETALAALVEWRDKKLKKAKKKGPVLDQYECIKMFLEENRTLGEAMDYAQNLFTNTGTINLLTCHKSKGHEFNEVFILDEFLMSDEGQDPNLRYVACTRTKRNLTYLETSNFIQGEE